jgi:hypothetical protein
MRVGINAHHAAEVERRLVPVPVEIQASAVTVFFAGGLKALSG